MNSISSPSLEDGVGAENSKLPRVTSLGQKMSLVLLSLRKLKGT